MSAKLSMIPLLVQSCDVPSQVRDDLRTFLANPQRKDVGCQAARGLMTSFADLSQREVMDLMGFEANVCA